MNLNKEMLHYSVPIIAERGSFKTPATGFFFVKKNKDETTQLFLITSYSSIANADLLTFGIKCSNEDYFWLSIKGIEKSVKNFEKSEYDIARINISYVYDSLTDSEAEQLKIGHLYKESIISTEENEKTGILEDLFVLSNSPINENQTLAIATKCQNATSMNNNIFFINLTFLNWRLGSPVFNEKNKLIGMITRLDNHSTDLCVVTPAKEIMELLEKGKEMI